MLPSIQTTPSCILCGSAVEPGVQYCAVCEDKPRAGAPRAMIEVKEQPEPPYHTSGNFRRPPPSKEEE